VHKEILVGSTAVTALRQPKPEDVNPVIPEELQRTKAIGLPGLSEPRMMRFVQTSISFHVVKNSSHYVKLSQKNFSLDTNMYPLGWIIYLFPLRLLRSFCRLLHNEV